MWYSSDCGSELHFIQYIASRNCCDNCYRRSPLSNLPINKKSSKKNNICTCCRSSLTLNFISFKIIKREEIIANNIELQVRHEIKIAKTLSLIVGTFLVLWTPAISLFLVMSITKNREIPLNYFMILERLIELNAAIDPFIYAYRTRNIREALERLFTCIKRRKSVLEESNLNTSKITKPLVYLISSTELTKL